ncbi:MAG: DUF4143 domain-containing protein [Pseudonocardiaceae bacterium]
MTDEFQRVPDLLAAIKSELNRDWRPGRFVLAGSARHEAVPELADFLAGRVELLRLWPFAMAELAPAAPSIVDRLFDGAVPRRRTSAMSRTDLVDVVLRGGYPIAVGLAPDARARWFGNLATLVGREIGLGRDQSGTYLRLFELGYLTVELPAWSPNLPSRVAKRPKLHLVDSGLAAHLQGVIAQRLAPIDPAGAASFGALLDCWRRAW